MAIALIILPANLAWPTTGIKDGAIFIGLLSTVIKRHGSTDYIGFSNSLSVCEKIVKGDLINKIKKNISKWE